MAKKQQKLMRKQILSFINAPITLINIFHFILSIGIIMTVFCLVFYVEILSYFDGAVYINTISDFISAIIVRMFTSLVAVFLGGILIFEIWKK